MMGWFGLLVGVAMLVFVVALTNDPNAFIPLAHAIFGH